MKNLVTFILLFFQLISLQYTAKALTSDDDKYERTMKQDLLCLMMAYPEYIVDVQRDANDYVYIVMKSGKKILYDDKRVKSAEEKLINADLQDTMEQIYPLSCDKHIMSKDFDPGRCRSYDLLKEVYGISREQVQANLTNVTFGYNYCQFNKSNKAASSLNSVIKELMPLSEKRTNIRAYIFPLSGTFNYRLIAGTNRLSPHSFGIAIDLARDKKDYWKWASLKEGEMRLASYPNEIVETFEKNNFIWGGKWGHFDILHFEYRPEIILKARYFGGTNKLEELWYDAVPYNETSIKEYIEKIDKLPK